MAGDFEGAEEAEAAVFGIGDGESSEAFIVDELDGVVDGRVGANGEDFGLHDVADLGADVGEEGGRIDVEEAEDEIDAFVGVSGSTGDDVGHSGKALELGVGEGCADGVHVRIFVTDDDREHVWRVRMWGDFGEEDGRERGRVVRDFARISRWRDGRVTGNVKGSNRLRTWHT